MHEEFSLLFYRFDGHEPHLWPCDRFANRRSIIRIVFSALSCHPVRRDEFRRNQPDGVAEFLELSRPVMSTRTCLYPHYARWQCSNGRQELVTANLWTRQLGRAQSSYAMERKDVLRQIDTKGDNCHGNLPFEWLNESFVSSQHVVRAATPHLARA